MLIVETRDRKPQLVSSFLGVLYVISANISSAKARQMIEPTEKADHPTHGVKVLQFIWQNVRIHGG